MSHHPEAQAGQAVAEQGLVLLEGPGALAIAFTPDAAEQTARNLTQAVEEARRQREDTY